MVICGSGHVAQALVKMVKLTGYGCTVIEDRKEFAEQGRQAGADSVICKNFEEAIRELSTDQKTFFVIMTREHQYDMVCLRAIYGKEYAYVGMMGSRRRTELVRQQLAEEGLPKEFLSQLQAPIGLPIHADTPEEIAVSVMAQIIEKRAEAGIRDDASPKFYEEIRKRKIHGSKSVLAEILRREGSAPRGKGARMLIDADGKTVDTIGGGYLEAVVIKRAQQLLEQHLPSEVMHISLQSLETRQNSMYCGGTVDVKLEPLC